MTNIKIVRRFARGLYPEGEDEKKWDEFCETIYGVKL